MMPWFKNTIVYEFKNEITLSKSALASALNAHIFKACNNQDHSKLGWVSPDTHHQDSLVIDIEGHWLLKAKKETKLLPVSVIRDALQLKISKIETIEQRTLKKAEKAALKDQVLTDLLPRAFSKYQHYFLWIDLKNKRIVIDSASYKQAEAVISLLRKCVGSLPVTPKSYDIPLELLLTKWVKHNHHFPPFHFGDETELKDALDGLGIIRCKQQELICDEITQHIHAGKQITQLKLVEKERVNFILQHDLTIKRIKYDASLLDKNEDIAKMDTEKRLKADFIIMTEVMSNVFNKINKIINALSIK